MPPGAMGTAPAAGMAAKCAPGLPGVAKGTPETPDAKAMPGAGEGTGPGGGEIQNMSKAAPMMGFAKAAPLGMSASGLDGEAASKAPGGGMQYVAKGGCVAGPPMGVQAADAASPKDIPLMVPSGMAPPSGPPGMSPPAGAPPTMIPPGGGPPGTSSVPFKAPPGDGSPGQAIAPESVSHKGGTDQDYLGQAKFGGHGKGLGGKGGLGTDDAALGSHKGGPPLGGGGIPTEKAMPQGFGRGPGDSGDLAGSSKASGLPPPGQPSGGQLGVAPPGFGTSAKGPGPPPMFMPPLDPSAPPGVTGKAAGSRPPMMSPPKAMADGGGGGPGDSAGPPKMGFCKAWPPAF